MSCLCVQITADVEVGPGGQVSFKEDDSYSLNLAPITVQVIFAARLSFHLSPRGLDQRQIPYRSAVTC